MDTASLVLGGMVVHTGVDAGCCCRFHVEDSADAEEIARKRQEVQHSMEAVTAVPDTKQEGKLLVAIDSEQEAGLGCADWPEFYRGRLRAQSQRWQRAPAVRKPHWESGVWRSARW